MLRERIITLHYRPGLPLNEKSLAEEFQVSRTPIREALIRLSEENLVTIIPRSGVRVSDINLVDLQELIGMRLILERGVAKLATQNATEKDIQDLEKLQEKVRSLKPEVVSEMMDCDTKFHQIIRQAAHNQLLDKFLKIIQHQFIRIEYLISYRPELIPTDYLSKVVAALKKRDAAEMERLMVFHADYFVARVKDFFK